MEVCRIWLDSRDSPNLSAKNFNTAAWLPDEIAPSFGLLALQKEEGIS